MHALPFISAPRRATVEAEADDPFGSATKAIGGPSWKADSQAAAYV